jgi:hypothetical protein
MNANDAVKRAPIFIGGMLRSGTTLLRAMLGQHSAIASGLETHWFDWDWAGRDTPEMAARLERLAVFFDTDAAAVRSLAADSPSAEGFLDRFMAAYAAAAGKRRWAEKTPGNMAVMPRIRAFWPEARLVHIRRDPRDVYASLRKSGKDGGPQAFAARWCGIVGQAERDKPAPGASNYLELQYEDLVTRPEPVMRRLLDFLGESWEPAVARFDGKPEEFGKVLAVTGKRSDVLGRLGRPLAADSIGAWQGAVPPAEIDAVRAAVAQRGFAALFDRIERAAAVAHSP